jgi:hypothetical protein
MFLSQFTESTASVIRFASEEETLSVPYLSIYHLLSFIYSDKIPRFQSEFTSQKNEKKSIKIESLRTLAANVVYNSIHLYEVTDNNVSPFIISCLVTTNSFSERDSELYSELDTYTTNSLAFDLIQLGELFFLPKLKGFPAFFSP